MRCGVESGHYPVHVCGLVRPHELRGFEDVDGQEVVTLVEVLHQPAETQEEVCSGLLGACEMLLNEIGEVLFRPIFCPPEGACLFNAAPESVGVGIRIFFL